MMTTLHNGRSGERGIAMIITMFMVLVLSLVGSSLVFVSQTETLSSLNYETMSQVRYAAESGVHSAANHILWTYVPPGTPGDPLANYDITVSPVQFNGAPVVLSSDPAASNYPVAAVVNAFAAASQGTLDVGDGSVAYTATAELLSMRQITDAFTGTPITLQSWRITGVGNVTGAGAARLEVSSVIERQDTPVYKYAAFATFSGCDALKFGGGAHTDSYDSSQYTGVGTPVITQGGGNVGTNGNLSEIGATTSIAGSLSTPRTGVGQCSANNVTALTQTNGATVSGGITQLSQAITFPTPPAPNPLPPTTNDSFQKNSGCPAAVAAICTGQAGVGATIHPTNPTDIVTLGNVSVTGGATLHLSAGIYVVNSISMAGSSSIIIDGAGPVIFQVAGQSETIPIDLTGGTVSNTTYKPSSLQFIYGGTGDVKLAGGTQQSALVYAPNAGVTITGGSDFYGAVVAGVVKDMGGAAIHYDRNLQKDAVTAGNPVMESFNWKSY